MQKKDILDAGRSMLDARRNGKSRAESQEPMTEDVPFGSNYVRLPGRGWIIVGIVFSAIFGLAPALWERFEKFEPEPNYRLPYESSSDYWLYDRYCRWACSRYSAGRLMAETLVVGDSVVWGHYVSRNNTLSHYLNQNAGRDQFINMGVDGFHPAALQGLLRYYGREISGKNVILHLNPLWMSSKKHDLQTTKEFHFNHPRLVPQFTPNIPCYKDSYSKKFSAVVERNVAFLSWTSHLKINYFGGIDLPTWTLEHPYENPLKAVTLELRASARLSSPKYEDYDQNEHVPWTEKGIAKADFQWVELATSLQWSFFQRTVEMLKARKNTVFVLVGPFNEHMLKEQSHNTYRKMKSEIEAWLQQNNVPHYIPSTLPSELYRDASHPLSEGYDMLAKQLFEDQSFKSSILDCGPRSRVPLNDSRDSTSPSAAPGPQRGL
ncbi:MAG: hypothetical protein ACYTBX_13200 [Planctomycetota bacterium]|jgi:hypothetical protein